MTETEVMLKRAFVEGWERAIRLYPKMSAECQKEGKSLLIVEDRYFDLEWRAFRNVKLKEGMAELEETTRT